MKKIPATNKKLLKATLIALFFFVLLYIGYRLYYQKHTPISNTPKSSQSPTVIGNNEKNAPKSAENTASPNNAPTNTASPSNSNTPSSTSIKLVAPFGQFVSNFGPISYSATNGSNQEESECQTTIGATCYVSFSNGSITQTLKPLIVQAVQDSPNGVASWSWTPPQVGVNGGLTPGKWTVTAVASLNGQQTTTTSSMELYINQ